MKNLQLNLHKVILLTWSAREGFLLLGVRISRLTHIAHLRPPGDTLWPILCKHVQVYDLRYRGYFKNDVFYFFFNLHHVGTNDIKPR